MKKNVLHKINIVLGAMSVLLAGCHSSKKVIAMYGVPYEPVADEVTLPADSVDTDTVMPTPQPGPIMTKYGIPTPVEWVP